MHGNDSRQAMKDILVQFLDTVPENNVDGERIWDAPLVGFSRGDDPCYAFFKEDIGEFFLSPLELFKSEYPDTDVKADELRVLSWILPQTKATKDENAAMGKYPGKRWAIARLHGQELNRQLAVNVVQELRALGYDVMSPMLSPLNKGETSAKYGYAATWSERHAAYTGGLGTFGLCDGLITPVGKAMRCGSVIIKASIEPTERKHPSHLAFCRTCGECIARCPVGAITTEGHDKLRCRAYLKNVTAPYIRENYELDIYGCGLCQTGTPCADGIPG